MTGQRWPYALGLDDAAEFCGISRNTLLRMVEAGKAPSPIAISTARRVWLRVTLEEWLDKLAGRAPAAATDEWTRADGQNHAAIPQGVPGAR